MNIIKKVTKKDRTHLYTLTKAKMEMPMLAATMVLLAIIIIQESFSLPEQAIHLFNITDILIWLLFVGELVGFTYLAPSRSHYLKTHWYDVLIVFLPFLRVFRVFNLKILTVLERSFLRTYKLLAHLFGAEAQLFRVFPLVAKFTAAARDLILKHKLNYLIAIIIAIVLLLGSLGSVFERTHPEANITNVYEGIWWGITSITTVGYGDRFPITLQGRLIGTVMMTLGVIIFSLLTANLASVFVEDAKRKEKKLDSASINARLTKMEEKIDTLIDEVHESKHS